MIEKDLKITKLMRKNFLLLLFVFITHLSFAQTGIGTVAPQASAILDLMSADKVLLLPRIDDTALIATPEDGMIAYINSSNCFKVYERGKWSDCIYRTPGKINSINCNGTPHSGTLKDGNAATGVYSVIAYTGGNGAMHNGQTVASTGVTGLIATLEATNFVNGNGTLLYTITGIPIGFGTATFAINIGGKTCNLTRDVLPSIAIVNSLNCAGGTLSGTFVKDLPASATFTLPYSGGNGGNYPAQTITSTGVTGLTANLAAGTLLEGNGTVTYTITGTPSAAGTAAFAITLGGKSCTLNLTVDPALIASLNCAGATQSGILVQRVIASGVSSTINYTGGNGGGYTAQTITSTGVTGLTANLTAGNFATGNGQLTYTITGTPNASGTANFAINIGGKSCTLSLTVEPPLVATLDCAGATQAGTLVELVGASGASVTIDYTGGNGGSYPLQTIASSGVTGLVARITAGNFAVGNGSLTYTITGTPSAGGTANFAINIGGKSCTLKVTVTPTTVLSLLCATATQTGTFRAGVAVTGASLTVSYTAGNGGGYIAQTVTSTEVTGLTASLAAGNAFGNGNLVYTITGTPSAAGSANFSITIGGMTCTVNVMVAITIPTNITLGRTFSYLVSSIYDTDYLPYTFPTAAAALTALNADGVADPTIDYQGTVTTTGITFALPVTATGNGTLPAYTSELAGVGAIRTEDGISRYVVLSWASQAYTSATKTITVNVRAIGGTLNVKKLDINSGFGNNALGVLLANLIYPYNNANTTTTLALRGVSGIPDRMFNVADNNGNATTHRFIYAPVMGEDREIWLKHNLGADYTNLGKPATFDPGRQVTSSSDYRAYGSLLQWGRKPDGHELMNWTNGTTGTGVYGNSATRNNAPTHSLFIRLKASGITDWRTSANTTLWDGVNAVNNPCPQGFRLPINTNFSNYTTVTGIKFNTAIQKNLRLVLPGERYGYTDSSVFFWGAGTDSGRYWTSNPVNNTATNYWLTPSPNQDAPPIIPSNAKTDGYSVRCIMD